MAITFLFGENFYMNHNCIILDGAKVEFGDNVFIAPNCDFYTAGHPLDYEKSKKKCTRFKTTNKKRTNPNSFKLCKNW